MFNSSSMNVTRLIIQLITTTDLQTLTLPQLNSLCASFDAVSTTDPKVLRRIRDFDAYRHQLEKVRNLKACTTTPDVMYGQPTIDGEEVTV